MARSCIIGNIIRTEYLPFGKPNFSEEEINAVTNVLRSGWIGMGPETIAFEKELAEFIGVPYVVAVNSCTSALFLSLLASGIKSGDEVICPSFTWCSTANAALYLGAKPIFCDVDSETLCVTPQTVMAKLTRKTKAVIVVHMGGRAIDVEELRSVLPRHVIIIEDAAHALGARYPDGQYVGSSGNLTCFSFYANKNLSTGEGGAIALDKKNLAEKFRSLRLHGMPVDAWKRFSNPKTVLYSELEELGYKMNYTDLQACIGRIQLKRLDEFYKIRMLIAQLYHDQLSKLMPFVKMQKDILDLHHARHLFQVLLPVEEMNMTRDEFLLALRERNIGASIHYAPLHSMPLYKYNKSLIHTENIYKRVVSLPISASMSLEDAGYVIKHFFELIKG